MQNHTDAQLRRTGGGHNLASDRTEQAGYINHGTSSREDTPTRVPPRICMNSDRETCG